MAPALRRARPPRVMTPAPVAKPSQKGPKRISLTTNGRLLECRRCNAPVLSSAWSGIVVMKCEACRFEEERLLDLDNPSFDTAHECTQVDATRTMDRRDARAFSLRSWRLSVDDARIPGVGAASAGIDARAVRLGRCSRADRGRAWTVSCARPRQDRSRRGRTSVRSARLPARRNVGEALSSYESAERTLRSAARPSARGDRPRANDRVLGFCSRERRSC